MSSFGKFVTSVTSKFGIVSRKAAMRLATETGMAIVDEGARLGRKLTVDEMASVMRRTLPKRCCPKLLSSRQEIADQIVRAGLATPQQASQIANNPKMLGGCVNNGTKKTTIFVESNPKIPAEFEYNFFSHELEHALEYNNRIKGIWNRKTQPFKLFLNNIFNGSEKSKNMQYVIQTRGGNFQAEVQQALGTFLTPKNFVLSCSPTREGLMELNGMSENRYLASIRRVLNKYVNAKSQGSMNNTMLSSFKRVIDLEIPAYTVGGRVYEYAKGLAKGQHSVSTGTAVLYRDAQKVIQQEQKLYWFNKLFGKLRKPTVFHSQKDLINLARTKEERKVIESIAKNMSIDNQKMLFTTLKSRPETLKNIQAFRNATMVNGKSLYDDSLSAIMDLNPKLLENSDFVKILRLQSPTFGYPVYCDALPVLSKTSPDKLKRFASIADETIMLEDRVVMKYECLAKHLDSPSYGKLKQLADIEINGTYPYHYIIEDMPRYLNSSQIDNLCQEAMNAKKNGSDIIAKIAQQIDDVACAQVGIKKCEASGIDVSKLGIKSV